MEGSPRITQSPAVAYEQIEAQALRGIVAFAVEVALVAITIILFVVGGAAHVLAIIFCVIDIIGVFGFVAVQPNESRVLILFGRYVGTVLESGWWWVNPLTVFWRETISLRVRNFQGQKIKVNDARGNPIEIAAVVVWKVVDTAKAVFDVEDFLQFVVVQAETAVRHVALQFPYDDYTEGAVSLRGSTDDVLQVLHTELQERLRQAGIIVLETRLTHLAYASEIAEVMLRRQQAEAIVAARQTMVKGAVGLVQMALNQLSAEGVVDFDPERKAAMVSNLMVVLSGDHSATPVINAGTLYT